MVGLTVLVRRCWTVWKCSVVVMRKGSCDGEEYAEHHMCLLCSTPFITEITAYPIKSTLSVTLKIMAGYNCQKKSLKQQG